MANPFQIGDDPDLSFGDEDFLLDSIDLEAIAAEALQTKPPPTGPTTNSSVSKPNPLQSNNTNQVATQNTKQFTPFNRTSHVNEQQNLSATHPLLVSTARSSSMSTLHSLSPSTPQGRVNKFNFKLKKSPDISQGGASLPRPISSSVQNSPHLESNKIVSPVPASANNTGTTVFFGARIPGGGTPNASHGLRSPLVQPKTSHVVQPPMGVTVKRDGSSVTSRSDQPTFNPQVNQGSSSSVNLHSPSAQQHGNTIDKLISRNLNQPAEQPTGGVKVFQRFVPQSTSSNPPNSGPPHALRPSQSANQGSSSASQLRNSSSQSMNQASNNTATQLRNLSMSSNAPRTSSFTALNQASSLSPPMQGSNSAMPQTSLQTSSSPSSASNSALRPSTNQPPKSFNRYQGPTDAPNVPGPSQPRNQPYSTPRTNPQFQSRSASPLHASTPGYRTPNGGPSPGSSRFQGVTTPMQPMGHAARYPTTPRAGASTFSTTGGTPRMRGIGSRPGSGQQVPQLTPRVAQLCQTISGNGSRSTIRTRARKFPGPAGVLPKLKPGQKLDDAVVEDLPSKEKKTEPSLDDSLISVSSQDSVDEFQRGAWLAMKNELGSSAQAILSSYNIAIVLRKASLKQLPRKQVPNLCVMIRQVTQTGCDACVMLKDPSGEMQGTLHRKIVDDNQMDLKPGSVMVLRKVGVLSPSIRNHYLNITPGNLVQIYPAESSSMPCSQTSPTRSQQTPSVVHRSPDNIDQQAQSKFTSTKRSHNHTPQDTSHHTGIFGMPVAHCIDAFYDAVTQFSRSWHRDVNIIKEVNLVEIDDDTVKTIQDHLVGKITGNGGGAVVRRNNSENQQRREPVRDHHRDSMVTGSSPADVSRDDSDIFEIHRFTSLPNFKRDNINIQDMPENGRGSNRSTNSKGRLGAPGYGNESSISLPKYDQSGKVTKSRAYDLPSTSERHLPYQRKAGDSALDATGEVRIASNESLIQTILNQHESGHQTLEQVEETQKLLDHLLGTSDRSTKKSYRSRRAQSLDSATRESTGKLKNQDLRGYDLHSDRRIKIAEDKEEFRKCSVCFSRRDLTNRKDCSHKLCRSCHRVGLYKGQCSFCKSKTNTPRSKDDRGRSKTKKGQLPDSKT